MTRCHKRTGPALALFRAMRRHRPRNRVLLWATRSLIFRSADPAGPRERRREPDEARPSKATHEIDWVSWLAEAELPEPAGEPAMPLARPSADLPASADAIQVSGNSLRVSLKIRHTI